MRIALQQAATHFYSLIRQRQVAARQRSIHQATTELQDTATRLSILYNLYALYADQPLEYNPFLTFFLELNEQDQERSNQVEQAFVQNILYGEMDEVHINKNRVGFLIEF